MSSVAAHFVFVFAVAAIALLQLQLCATQKYTISNFSTTIVNPARPNHEIPLLIWYPTPLPRAQTVDTVDAATDFPILVFGHCLFGRPDWYPFYWQTLVPQGFIFAFPASDALIGDEKNFAMDLRYTLDWLLDNCSASSNACPPALTAMIGVGSKAMISGHSLGAGSALYATGDATLGTFTHAFDAMMTLSACGGAENQLNSFCKNVDIPTFIMDGSHDCMCPPTTWADIQYQNIDVNAHNSGDHGDSQQTAKAKTQAQAGNGFCKYEGLIENGTHCNFADLSFAREESCIALEEAECPPDKKSHISDRQQLDITGKLMALFMEATLVNYNNADAYDALNKVLATDLANGVMSKVLHNCTTAA